MRGNCRGIGAEEQFPIVCPLSWHMTDAAHSQCHERHTSFSSVTVSRGQLFCVNLLNRFHHIPRKSFLSSLFIFNRYDDDEGRLFSSPQKTKCWPRFTIANPSDVICCPVRPSLWKPVVVSPSLLLGPPPPPGHSPDCMEQARRARLPETPQMLPPFSKRQLPINK